MLLLGLADLGLVIDHFRFTTKATGSDGEGVPVARPATPEALTTPEHEAWVVALLSSSTSSRLTGREERRSMPAPKPPSPPARCPLPGVAAPTGS